MDFTNANNYFITAATSMIDAAEKGTRSVVAYMPEPFKSTVIEMSDASFDLVRTTQDAFIKFGDVVQKQVKMVA